MKCIHFLPDLSHDVPYCAAHDAIHDAAHDAPHDVTHDVPRDAPHDVTHDVTHMSPMMPLLETSTKGGTNIFDFDLLNSTRLSPPYRLERALGEEAAGVCVLLRLGGGCIARDGGKGD